jgi:hypothetical protein
MDEIPEAPENSGLVRYGFAAIFIAACLYDLHVGIRVAGVFLLGLSVYEAILGRVPLMGPFSWKARGYLTGSVAMALLAAMVFLSVFLILAPDIVIAFLAKTN